MKISLFGKEIVNFSNDTKSVDFQTALRALASDSTIKGNPITRSTAYSRQEWVYACVNAIARNIARVPFQIFRGDQLITDGPIPKLFNTVNQFLDPAQLWEGTTIYKQLAGNAFWHIVGEGSIVHAIELLIPQKMRPLLLDGELVAWEYTNSKGRVTRLAPIEVIQFKYFNPDNPVIGLAPLTPAMEQVRLDDKGRMLSESVLSNGSFPGGILTAPRNLTDPEYDRIMTNWKKKHQGASNAGEPALLEGGMTYSQPTLTMGQVELIEQKKLTKDAIHAIFSVPTAITGDTSSFNRANMDATLRQFWDLTLIPQLKSYEDNLNTNFFDVYAKGLKGKFDLTVISELQEGINDLIDSATKLYALGIPAYDINERLGLGFDLDSKPWTKTWWKPFALVDVEDDINGVNDLATQAPAKSKDMFKSFETFLNTKNPEIDPAEKKDFILWKNLIDKIDPIERQYSKKLKAWFFKIRKEVLSNVLKSTGATTKIIEGPNFDSAAATKRLIEISTPYLEESIQSGMETGFDELDTGSPWTLQPESGIDALKSRTGALGDITERMSENITDTITDGLRAGKTNAEIGDEIRTILNASGARSRMIARTEINGAANEGKLLGYLDAGVDHKRWLHSFDGHVRTVATGGYNHLLSSAEIIPINDEFSNGLKQPGDRTGSGSEAGNIINCRCTVLAVLREV